MRRLLFQNIRRDVIDALADQHFGDCWRVFGRYADLPPAQLPRDTALRKAYAEWLTAGNPSGSGMGFFVFDGEKIIK